MCRGVMMAGVSCIASCAPESEYSKMAISSGVPAVPATELSTLDAHSKDFYDAALSAIEEAYTIPATPRVLLRMVSKAQRLLRVANQIERTRQLLSDKRFLLNNEAR